MNRRDIGSYSRQEAQLMEDVLYRIRQVNYMPEEIKKSLLEFKVDDQSLGKIRPGIVELLCQEGVDNHPVFQMEQKGSKAFVTLSSYAGTTFDSRSAAVARVMQQLRDRGIVKGWRDELYPIGVEFYKSPMFTMERAAVPFIGAVEYGVHVNGLVKDGDETKMWIARRSKDKSKYPGMLDHIVAGGVPEGISLMDNVIKECMEEAGIPEELTRQGVRPAGAISYETFSEKDDTIARVVLFNYDLHLPASFVPKPVDGEVEEFFLMTINEVKATMAKDYPDPIKPNCYSVIIDYLLREGHLSPEVPGYIHAMRELRGGDSL